MIESYENGRAAKEKDFKLRAELGIAIPTKHFSLLVERGKNLDAEIEEEELEDYKSSKRIKLF